MLLLRRLVGLHDITHRIVEDVLAADLHLRDLVRLVLVLELSLLDVMVAHGMLIKIAANVNRSINRIADQIGRLDRLLRVLLDLLDLCMRLRLGLGLRRCLLVNRLLLLDRLGDGWWLV